MLDVPPARSLQVCQYWRSQVCGRSLQSEQFEEGRGERWARLIPRFHAHCSCYQYQKQSTFW